LVRGERLGNRPCLIETSIVDEEEFCWIGLALKVVDRGCQGTPDACGLIVGWDNEGQRRPRSGMLASKIAIIHATAALLAPGIYWRSTEVDRSAW
jgi:hypothetical protein